MKTEFIFLNKVEFFSTYLFLIFLLFQLLKIEVCSCSICQQLGSIWDLFFTAKRKANKSVKTVLFQRFPRNLAMFFQLLAYNIALIYSSRRLGGRAFGHRLLDCWEPQFDWLTVSNSKQCKAGSASPINKYKGKNEIWKKRSSRVVMSGGIITR